MVNSERTGILGLFSGWFRMLALIVIVAEAIILVAMKASPDDHPLVAYYPIFMLLFLCVIVLALFFDRWLQYKKQVQENIRIKLDNYEASVDSSTILASEATFEDADTNLKFVDSKKGFMFDKPSSTGWSDPQYMDTYTMFSNMGLLTENQSYEEFMAAGEVVPMGSMIFNSENILFTFGEKIECEVTDNTSNKIVDTLISRLIAFAEKSGDDLPTDEEISVTKKKLLFSNINIEKFNIQNTFAVHIYDKNLAAHSPIKANISNMFIMIAKQHGGSVDKLVANENAIMWGSQQTLTNIKIADQIKEVKTYTLNTLFENKRYIFEINILFSPQTETPIMVWDDLQQMLDSFQVINILEG